MYQQISFLVLSQMLTGAAALNVAIIGAGAGGSSSAWWLRQLMPDIEIDVYERRKHAGGRAFKTKVFGVDVEVGASIVIKENKYFADWVEMFNLTVVEDQDGALAIDNGQEFVFNGDLTFWTILWRYGLRAPYYMHKFATSMIDSFGKIYAAQDKGILFHSAQGLWSYMGLLDSAVRSCEDITGEAIGQGLDGPLMNELVSGAARVNYNQRPMHMTGLVCAMSIAPAASQGVYKVKEGNMEVFERVLANASVTTYFHTYVTQINKTDGKYSISFKSAPVGCGPRGDWPSEDGTIQCESSDGCGEVRRKDYDAVIIATPQFFDDVPQFNQSLGPLPERRYKHVFVTFTCGEAKRGGSKLKSVLFTGDADTEINSVSRGPPCDNGKSLWKFCSTAKLTAEDIDRYVDRGNDTAVEEFQWFAYPKFDANTIPELELTPGLFYVPAVEAATSAMEVSIVSGRNAALLTHDFLKPRMGIGVEANAKLKSELL